MNVWERKCWASDSEQVAFWKKLSGKCWLDFKFRILFHKYFKSQIRTWSLMKVNITRLQISLLSSIPPQHIQCKKIIERFYLNQVFSPVASRREAIFLFVRGHVWIVIFLLGSNQSFNRKQKLLQGAKKKRILRWTFSSEVEIQLPTRFLKDQGMMYSSSCSKQRWIVNSFLS